MRKYFLIIVSVLVVAAIADKRVYIPRDLRGINLNDSTSKWSWRNSVQTEDVVFFWQQPFGHDPAKAPKLEGKPMTFDLDNVVKRVQYFYNFYRDSLHFLSTPSNADSLKMMVMINYSLEGTAYGGDYDNRIGALWVAPNRMQDRNLNCLAHELGHSFQRQITSDGAGEAWGGSGFFEMTSQWMLWQVNPDWPTEENYHLQAFRKATHKAFLAPENIYRSPYVLEYWAEKHGRAHIAKLFREGKRGEDPAMTYMRVNGLTQQQFCDELFDCYSRLLNFDFSHAYSQTRRHACTFSTPLDTIGIGHYRIPADYQPEPYGFNAIKIGKTQKAKIKNIHAPKGHFLRWTIVDEPDCRYLLVMNQPERHSQLPHRRAGKETLPTISYEIIVEE